jgi:DNA-binding CsgD family transcriptional regulator
MRVALPPEAPPGRSLELVGRDAELRTLRNALEAPTTRGIVLEGEAGIGKTALWQAGIEDAKKRGRRALVARPAETESTLSHAALGDLLAPLAEELGAALPAPQRHALDVALLRASPDAGAVDARAVGAAALAVLQAAAREVPVLLAVDDVQWLDPASSAVLGYALRRLEDDPVVLLATRRLGIGIDRVELGLGEDRIARVAVGPLGVDDLHRILQNQLGEPVPRPAVTRIADVSGGNPYYALELARAAVREAGSSGLTAELPLPDGIYVVLQDRIRSLPEPTQDALGAIAAMGHPTIAAATEAVDAGVLDAAFAAGVLREQRERIHFEHPLLSEAAYRLLLPSHRRAVHERLAGLTTDSEQRARHLAAAATQPDSAVAAAIERGATEAAARGAPAAAAELLEAAARFEPEREPAALRRIAAVREHVAAGDGRRAIAVATALVEELPPGPLRARALVTLAEQEGQTKDLSRFAAQAVEEAGDDRDVLIEALLAQGVGLFIEGSEDQGYEATKRAYELCAPGTPRPLRIQAMTYYGELAQFRGEPDGMRLLREAAELEGDELIPDAYRGAGTRLGRALGFADELDEGRRMLEERLHGAIELGDDESRVGLLFHLSELEVRAGELDAALRRTEEGVAIHEGSYAELGQSVFSYVIALIRAHQGETDLARRVAQEGLARCEAHNEGLFGAIHRATLAFLDFSLGDNDAAVEWMRPIAEEFQAKPFEPGLPHIYGMPDAVEALATLERLEEAEELLAAWDEAGELFDRPRVRATSARSRAVIAAARGDLDTALAHSHSAVAQSRDLPLPFDLARSLIVLGSLYRRTKQKAAARAALEEAVSILEPLGARLWADRARADLARISGRARAGGLTPTEERVAKLVADGRSNKEVAEALFVSVRTVEANLTRIYAKLGIRSRTELASRRGR